MIIGALSWDNGVGSGALVEAAGTQCTVYTTSQTATLVGTVGPGTLNNGTIVGTGPHLLGALVNIGTGAIVPTVYNAFTGTATAATNIVYSGTLAAGTFACLGIPCNANIVVTFNTVGVGGLNVVWS